MFANKKIYRFVVGVVILTTSVIFTGCSSEYEDKSISKNISKEFLKDLMFLDITSIRNSEHVSNNALVLISHEAYSITGCFIADSNNSIGQLDAETARGEGLRFTVNVHPSSNVLDVYIDSEQVAQFGRKKVFEAVRECVIKGLRVGRNFKEPLN